MSFELVFKTDYSLGILNFLHYSIIFTSSNQRLQEWSRFQFVYYTVEPPSTATSLQRPLSSVPKMADVERFNCITWF